MTAFTGGAGFVLDPALLEAAATQSLQRGKILEALPLLRQAVAAQPDKPGLLHNFGTALAMTGATADALPVLRRAWSLQPDSHLTASILVRTLGLESRWDEMAALCRDARARWPADTALLRAHAHALAARADPAALDLLRQAAATLADDPEAQHDLGTAYGRLNRLDDAHACFARTLILKPGHPGARFNRAYAHLLQGDFTAAWPDYEARFAMPGAAPARHQNHPRWTGDDPAGRTILLHAEQGFGDTLFCIRYAPLLAASSARVLLEVPPALVRLLAPLPGPAGVFPLDAENLPPFDAQIPMMSLPGAFATTPETIPATIPYLQAPTRPRTLPPGRNIGLAWTGNPGNPRHAARTPPPEAFAALLATPGIRLWSVLPEPIPAPLQPHLHPPPTPPADFADTAALLTQLDLLITVDTAAAHLAGALGIPVWLLLPFAPDFRWMLNRNDTPWYPTMRLFRQPAPDDWASVIAQVVSALCETKKAVLF